MLEIEIVIKARVDCRSDCEFHIAEQSLDCLRHYVRRRVS